jgi:PPM family protein phosphatase
MPPSSRTLTLDAHGATDAGKRRSGNEDAVLIRDDLALYLVADGVGGHGGGEIASRLALRSIENFFGATIRVTHARPEFDRFGIPRDARRLSAAILKANRDVREIAGEMAAHKGMGTTVVAACFSPTSGLLHVAHVGDSRCYRMRGEHLELLTQDHSIATDIVERRPDLQDDVLERLPMNVVTRALGMSDDLRVSLRSFTVVAGDKYLLCSDGLHGMVGAEELAETLGLHEPAEATVRRLIANANAAGGADNITAVVIDCHGGYQHARPADEADTERGSRLPQTSDPELLILGIEELDAGGHGEKKEDLLRRLSELLDGPR